MQKLHVSYLLCVYSQIIASFIFLQLQSTLEACSVHNVTFTANAFDRYHGSNLHYQLLTLEVLRKIGCSI